MAQDTTATTNPGLISGMNDPNPPRINTGVYAYFSEEDDIVTGSIQTITEGFFTNNDGEITSFFTSSTQAALSSSRYYLDIYQVASTTTGAEIQFDIATATSGGLESTGDD